MVRKPDNAGRSVSASAVSTGGNGASVVAAASVLSAGQIRGDGIAEQLVARWDRRQPPALPGPKYEKQSAAALSEDGRPEVTCFAHLVQASGATAEELLNYSAAELVELLQVSTYPANLPSRTGGLRWLMLVAHLLELR